VNENLVCNLNFTHVEDVVSAPFHMLEATGVRNREVCSDRSCPVIVVPDPVVVAAAAVKVALHRVPLGSDVTVVAVSILKCKVSSYFDFCLFLSCSQESLSEF
jgi:hypothetical protein